MATAEQCRKSTYGNLAESYLFTSVVFETLGVL